MSNWHEDPDQRKSHDLFWYAVICFVLVVLFILWALSTAGHPCYGSQCAG